MSGRLHWRPIRSKLSDMSNTTFVLLVLCVGALCGLRTFTPLAIFTIALHHDRFSLAGTPLAFLGTFAAHIVIVLLAIGELIADKLPAMPSRLRPQGLMGRAALGAVTCAAYALAQHHAVLLPAVLGIIGAIAGAFLGNRARSVLARAFKSPDLPIALLEDAICIIGSLFIFMRA